MDILFAGETDKNDNNDQQRELATEKTVEEEVSENVNDDEHKGIQ